MIRLTENEALKGRHTLGVQAYSRYFLETNKLNELFDFKTSHEALWSHHLIIGEGSNLLFKSDYPGLIIHPLPLGIKVINNENDYVIIEAGAAENWDYLVDWTVNQGFAGLENLSLIPGSVGAAPVQNIGAYGAEAKDFITEVLVGDLNNNTSFWVQADKCKFGYRDSIFKQKEQSDWLVWKVRFKLYLDGRTNQRYQGLKKQLKDMLNPGIKEVRQAIKSLRTSKLPDPKETGNAGSFFKNPIISDPQANELLSIYPDLPVYPCDKPDHMKLAAAWLIEQCGLKGHRRNDAGIYPKQALVLVNYGNATGEQLFELAAYIQNTVQQKFEIKLEPEVRIV
ncbi:MAG: UDP-N-acetylmuramate dehydrogenase [Bacteroidales bacterium]|nr:UDP-N-acetylmuramate dehydrogenase [Bacteroidales bacterium]